MIYQDEHVNHVQSCNPVKDDFSSLQPVRALAHEFGFP